MKHLSNAYYLCSTHILKSHTWLNFKAWLCHETALGDLFQDTLGM